MCPQTSAAFSFTSCTGSAISGVQGSAGIQKQPPTQVLGLRSRRNNWMYNSSYIYLDYLASLTCTQTLYTQVFVKQLPQSRQEFVLAGRPTSWSASLKCCNPHLAVYHNCHSISSRTVITCRPLSINMPHLGTSTIRSLQRLRDAVQ